MLLNLLSSHYLFPTTTNYLPFSPFSAFPISPLGSVPFSSPHFTISLAFLLGLCCPRGVRDRLGDSLYVTLSWPELPSWGSFDGVGDYSSCSLGCIPLSHTAAAAAAYTYTDTHIRPHSWKITALIVFLLGEIIFSPVPQYDVALLSSRYCPYPTSITNFSPQWGRASGHQCVSTGQMSAAAECLSALAPISCDGNLDTAPIISSWNMEHCDKLRMLLTKSWWGTWSLYDAELHAKWEKIHKLNYSAMFLLVFPCFWAPCMHNLDRLVVTVRR